MTTVNKPSEEGRQRNPVVDVSPPLISPHITESPETLSKLSRTQALRCGARSNDCMFASLTCQDQKSTLHYKFILSPSHTDTPKWPALTGANEILTVVPLKKTPLLPKAGHGAVLRRRHIACQNPVAPPSCRRELVTCSKGTEIPIHEGPPRGWVGDELSNKNIRLKKKKRNS